MKYIHLLLLTVAFTSCKINQCKIHYSDVKRIIHTNSENQTRTALKTFQARRVTKDWNHSRKLISPVKFYPQHNYSIYLKSNKVLNVGYSGNKKYIKGSCGTFRIPLLRRIL